MGPDIVRRRQGQIDNGQDWRCGNQGEQQYATSPPVQPVFGPPPVPWRVRRCGLLAHDRVKPRFFNIVISRRGRLVQSSVTLMPKADRHLKHQSAFPCVISAPIVRWTA